MDPKQRAQKALKTRESYKLFTCGRVSLQEYAYGWTMKIPPTRVCYYAHLTDALTSKRLGEFLNLHATEQERDQIETLRRKYLSPNKNSVTAIKEV